MKKRNFIITLLAIALTFGMASCNKIEKTIIGTWVSGNTTALEGEFEASEFDGTTFTFNDNKTVAASINAEEGVMSLNGTYSIDGDKLNMVFEQAMGPVSAKVNFDMDVTKNSKTSLTLSGSMTTTVSGGGMNESDLVKLKTTLTKK
ncbi:MAG: lipocalin family protein [Bacteroidaceae bacterium]|nr:lipocalin family protein [Bacteroidaceae bacterium]